MTTDDAGPPPDPLALAEYRPHSGEALTDAERWPTLTGEGRARLDALRGHPLAPAWTHAAGDRLDAAAAARAAAPLPAGDWLPGHLATARRLPAYRRYPGPLEALADFPPISREDLLADVSAFVPLDADLDAMVEGSSSGTTGRAVVVPDHVEEVARTVHLLASLVAGQGVEWAPDAGRMAVAHLVHQRRAYTYASVLSTFGWATIARMSMHPSHWPGEPSGAARRDAFLLDRQPQVVTGDPTALAGLLDPALAAGLRPLAVVSGAMHLAPALRDALGAAYRCPVLDVYGLHETRPVAVSPDGGPFRVLDRRVLVEVLDEAGDPVPPGARGEIVVTAGENPLLPLVRYRTGDHGRLVEVDGRSAIADLEGRDAVVFAAGDGSAVPCVELTQQLQACGAHGWSVEQAADGSVVATVVRGDAAAAGRALSALLGRPVAVRAVEGLGELGEGKPRRYASRIGSP